MPLEGVWSSARRSGQNVIEMDQSNLEPFSHTSQYFLEDGALVSGSPCTEVPHPSPIPHLGPQHTPAWQRNQSGVQTSPTHIDLFLSDNDSRGVRIHDETGRWVMRFGLGVALARDEEPACGGDPA